MGYDGLFVIIVVGIVFGSVVALVALPMWFRERTKQSAHKLISEAIAKGQTLDPALIEKLSEGLPQRQQSSPRRTLGSAVVMLALGAAFALAGYMDGGWMDGGFMNIPAMILGFLGLAFLVLAIVDYNSQKKKTDA
ncbi:MAG TPA: DUF6249 domain-containing protein [Caulobacterales bacterium]|nr:DUF6249 domain-containing protein [Caulobacterales bacterium]